jgi:hypothetical protein
MKRTINALVLIIVTGALLIGCDITDRNSDLTNSQSDHFSSNQLTSGTELNSAGEMDYFNDLLDTYTDILINDYRVTFKGAEKFENNGEAFTTFSYRVSRTGETPQLDSFFLEIPKCAGDPVSWSFTQSAKIEVGGIRWNRSVS